MTDPAPDISVIVPTFNRRDRLHRALSGLAAQRLDDITFEVIVVSDGSTDGTDEYLEGSSVPIDVIAVRQDNAGPAAARNRGVEAATGALCVFMDDDIVPDPALLMAHAEAHRAATGPLVTIGPMLTPPDADFSPWVDWEQRMLDKQYDALRDESMPTTARQFYTGNTAIRREHLVAAGGFDESFRRAEDIELAYRLGDAGLQFEFIDEAVGLHYAERSFDSWRDNAYQYGRNDVVFALHRDRPWMLPLIARQFEERHVLIRRLTRSVVRFRRLHRSGEAVLRAVVSSAGAVGARQVQIAALSGIYNFAYYVGVDDAAESIGGLEPILRAGGDAQPFVTSPIDGGTDARPRARVLFLHSATHERLGADEWVHMRIIEGLDPSTHDIHVGCVTNSSRSPTLVHRTVEPLDHVSVVAVHPGPTGPVDRSPRGICTLAGDAVRGLAGLARLTWFVRRHRIDVIHTNDRPRDAFAAVCIGKVTRTPSIVHAHVLYGEWMSGALTWSYRHADGVLAVSEFVRDGLVAAGVEASRTFTVHNAIEIERWTHSGTADEMRSSLGIPDDAVVVITVCRLFEEKGVRPLIEAVGEVHARHPEVRLLVVGDELEAGGSYLADLRTQVEAHGWETAVSFLGHRRDVVALMSAADIFAMPSFEEPFGLVFAEAMAMQLPVVGLDNGGTREVVRHGIDGLLSAPGDHDALVQHLLQLVEDPDLRRRLGDAGRQRVEQDFTIERMVADVVSVYRLVS